MKTVNMPRELKDRSHQHRLTDVDFEAKTGVCSLCGPVKIRIKNGGKGRECVGRRKIDKTRANHRRRLAQSLSDMSTPKDAYDAMLEAQGGLCALCMKPSEKRLAIDHDHSCCPGVKACGGCVRGLLCVSCNLALGLFKDDAEVLTRAVIYLQR